MARVRGAHPLIHRKPADQPKVKDMDIRPAVQDDLEELLDLAEEFHSESLLSDLDFDRSHTAKFLETSLKDPFSECHVADSGGQISGVFILRIDHYVFAHTQPFFVNQFLYVRHKFRFSRIPLKLIQHMLDVGKMRGANEIFLSASSGINVGSLERLLEKKGFTRVGGMYRGGQLT